MPIAPSPRVYARLIRCAFQRRAAYRLANFTGIFVNFFFFLVHAQVFLAFFGGRGEVAGWTAEHAVLYFATSEALLMVLGAMSGQVGADLERDIRSGDVTLELAKPLRVWARHLSVAYGEGLYFLAARATVLYTAACLWYGLAPPVGEHLLWFPISLVMAIGIQSLLTYAAAATAYWFESARGPRRTLLFLGFLFGGVIVPLDFYPDGFRAVCDVLPFRGAIYTPVALATGKLTGSALVFGLTHQLAWFVGLAWLAHAMESRGTARLAALGG